MLRHQFECGTQGTISDDAPIMVWMIRRVGELIPKYAIGDDGKTAYERIRGESCVAPVMPFGEIAMFLPLRTTKHSNDEAAREPGAWLGTIERTEETLIGTAQGVIKCRVVNRLPEGDRWNLKLVAEMQGVPWEPVLGRSSDHIPAQIGNNGQIMDEAEENTMPGKEDIEEHDQEPEYNTKTHTTCTYPG